MDPGSLNSYSFCPSERDLGLIIHRMRHLRCWGKNAHSSHRCSSHPWWLSPEHGSQGKQTGSQDEQGRYWPERPGRAYRWAVALSQQEKQRRFCIHSIQLVSRSWLLGKKGEEERWEIGSKNKVLRQLCKASHFSWVIKGFKDASFGFLPQSHLLLQNSEGYRQGWWWGVERRETDCSKEKDSYSPDGTLVLFPKRNIVI